MCGHRRARYAEWSHQRRSDPHTRASDADRERVTDALRRHAGEGRLDPDELEERLEAAFAARTLGDLDALTRDLPRSEPRRSGHRTRGPMWAPPLIVTAVLVAVAVTVLIGHPVFWLFFLLLLAKHRRPWPAYRL